MRSVHGHVFLTYFSKRVNVIPIAPGMYIPVPLTALTPMHPRLLWDDIIAATVAVLSAPGARAPYDFAPRSFSLPLL